MTGPWSGTSRVVVLARTSEAAWLLLQTARGPSQAEVTTQRETAGVRDGLQCL